MISIFHFCQNILLKQQWTPSKKKKQTSGRHNVQKPICSEVLAPSNCALNEIHDGDFSDPNTPHQLEVAILVAILKGHLFFSMAIEFRWYI